MKSMLLLLVVVVVALSWFGLARLKPASPEPSIQIAKVSSPEASNPSTKLATPSPAVAPMASVSEVAKPPEMNPAELPQIVLEDVLDPNNHYHDDLLGVSADLPEGWKVRSAQRWGSGNRENTVFLLPATETSARPSMYYQMYPKDVPQPGQAEAYLRNIADWKENSRIQAGLTDYKNVPDSFEFSDANGRPTLSYFATFSRGDDTMTEYFVRVLGEKGYVMFFTTGKLEDVKSIMAQVKQTAASVKVP